MPPLLFWDITLRNNQIFRYEGGKQGTLYDKNWNVIKTIDLDIESTEMAKGNHSLTVDCNFLSDDKSEIKLEVKTIGEPTLLTK